MTATAIESTLEPTAEPTGATKATITIARSALRAALGKLMSVVDTSVKALPVAQHVLLDARDGHLTLSAMDFASFVRLSLPCDCATDAVALLPAKLLSEIVASLPPTNAVTITIDGPCATIVAGRSRFELPGLQFAEYPLWPEIATDDARENATAGVIVDATAWLDAITRCADHASDAESRPILNAVLCERDEHTGTAIIVGTDGQSLARLSGGPIAGRGPMAQLLIHRLSVPLLAKAFAGLDADATLTLTADANRLLVEGPNAAVLVRLVEGPYPKYRQIITQDPTHTVEADRLLFAAAVRRVGLTSDSARRIAITLDADEMTLRGASDKLGTASDAISIETKGRTRGAVEPFSCCLNATKLAIALGTLTADRVQLTAQGPDDHQRPVFIRAADQGPADPTAILVMSLRSY